VLDAKRIREGGAAAVPAHLKYFRHAPGLTRSFERKPTDHLTGSLAYLNEGDVQRGRRAGLAPQIWLEDDLTYRLAVGVGVGPYFAMRKPRRSNRRSASTVSALISITAAYAITPEWIGRLIWNRVETRYDRDADVVMFALGYRF
jgi:hypothetical protein